MRNRLSGIIAIIIILATATFFMPAFEIVSNFEGMGGDSKTLPPIFSKESFPASGSFYPHEPLLEIDGHTKRGFVRISVGDTYRDGTWYPEYSSDMIDYTGQTLPKRVDKFGSFEENKVTLKPKVPINQNIPVFAHTSKIENLSELRFSPNDDVFYRQEPVEEPYEISYRIYSIAESSLDSAELISDNKYLQIPSSISENTIKLAKKITAGIETPYQKAKAIENYLKNNYVYDKNYETAPIGKDPVNWFLFEEKRGVCWNFNSAFAIMARAVDLPTRVVFGLKISPNKEKQTVYADQSHLRVEIGFEDFGWIPLDATPGSQSSVEQKLKTRTIIEQMDELAFKGEAAQAKGRVMDENNNPLGGFTVKIYLAEEKWEGGKLVGENITDENGVFNAYFTIPDNIEVGEYWVVAHALEKGEYQDSWSDPPIKIMGKTGIELSAPESVLIHENFVVNGKLIVQPTHEELERMRVNLSLGNQNWSKSTSENGSFELKYNTNMPGNYLITASFPGTEYYEPSVSEYSLDVSLLKTSPYLENSFVRGQDVQISGKTTLTNESMRLLIENEFIGEGKTDGEGNFSVDYTVPQSYPLGEAKLTFEFPETSFSKSKNVIISGKTSIEYWKEDTVQAGESFKVKARVRDDQGNPIVRENLILSHSSENLKAKTDKNGEATFEINLPKDYENDNFLFQIRFPKQRHYLPSEVDGNYPLSDSGGFTKPFLGIAVALVGALIAFTAVYLSKRDVKSRTYKRNLPNLKADKAEEPVITFPSCEDGFPKVWGVNQLLNIVIQPDNEITLDKDGLVVKVDGEEKNNVKLSSKNKIEFKHRFKNKGKHSIEVLYRNNFSLKREVNIVEYDEEVVKMYTSIFKELLDKIPNLKKEVTSRELLREVAKYGEIDYRDFKRMTQIFEKALYSSRNIDRDEYVESYLIWSSINKHKESEEK